MQRPEEEPARTCRDSYLEQVSGGVLNEGGCDDESWCRIRLLLSRAAVYTAKPPNNIYRHKQQPEQVLQRVLQKVLKKVLKKVLVSKEQCRTCLFGCCRSIKTAEGLSSLLCLPRNTPLYLTSDHSLRVSDR